MKFVNTHIEGLVILEPSVFEDDRGYFSESYNKNKFEKAIGEISFVQDNESKSFKGVLRGLHFQKPPYDQAKLVRCIEGKVSDPSRISTATSNTLPSIHLTNLA